MELIVLAIWLILTALTSFLGARLSAFLDTCLDYGHIFGRIRLREARKAAKRSDLLDYFESQKDIYDKELFGDRLRSMDSLYWEIATKNNEFLIWICPTCMTTRITLYLAHIMIPVYSLLFWEQMCDQQIIAGLGMFGLIIFAPILSTYKPLKNG